MSFTHVQRVRILYKTILKLHKGLPSELQLVGSTYTRDEFKRHKNCNEREAEIFVDEWTNYAISLANQLGLRGPKTGSKKLGIPLTKEEIETLRDDQICQLYELMEESSKPKLTEESKKKL